MFDIVIIGAGVVGSMIARELTRYGASVCSLEKENDVAMGATKANSAIVHAGFDAKEGSLKSLLNVKGSKMMEKVCSELGVKYRRNGSLVVGFNEEDRKTLVELKERGERAGVPGLRVVDRDELVALEKNIGDDVSCALVAESGAIVCPYELCIAAMGNAMDNGAELRLNFEVDKIEKTEDGYKVYSGNDFVEGKFLLNCAGVFSDDIAAMVGDNSFSIEPRRGEYMLLDKECGSLIDHTVFRCPSVMGKGILVTPTVDGNLLLGPTAEDIEDKSDVANTRDGLADVRAKAFEQVKGINLAKTITSFAGLRAKGSTGDFIIKAFGDRFVNVAGIESPGLSASPAIAEYVREMLQNMGLVLSPREDFNPIREADYKFRELPMDEKNRIIADRPEFAHIICRCEGISEGEILDAIRRNPKPSDIDGVKRRTRASMGRCQGGFCTPYITELLAKELGMDYCDVTKFGKNSYVNVGKTK